MRKGLFAVVLGVALCSTLAAAKIEQRNTGAIEEGGVLTQVAQGGGWGTELQVVNTDDEGRQIPYTITFFRNGGQPMNVTVFDANGMSLGTGNMLAGISAYPGADFFFLPNMGELNAGYAVIEASDFRVVMVNAVLTQSVPGRPDFQASVPSLDRAMDRMRFAFRNTPPYTTTLALASSFTDTGVIAIARDSEGMEMCRNEFSMKEGDHMAVILRDFLPCTAGKAGLVEIISDFIGISGIAFLFNDAGAFTTQLPFQVCCIF